MRISLDFNQAIYRDIISWDRIFLFILYMYVLIEDMYTFLKFWEAKRAPVSEKPQPQMGEP